MMDHNTALHVCCKKDNVVYAKILLDAGVDINVRNGDGHTALYYAITYFSNDVARLLIVRNPNLVNNDEYPLHLACAYSNYDIVKFLLDCDADINRKDEEGLTPLHLACVNNNLEIITYLLDHHPDVPLDIPLYLITDSIVLEKIMEHGFDITKNNSLLHNAVITNNIVCVKFLLSKGIDVNKQTSEGLTSLMLSIKKGNSKITQLLITYKHDF